MCAYVYIYTHTYVMYMYVYIFYIHMYRHICCFVPNNSDHLKNVLCSWNKRFKKWLEQFAFKTSFFTKIVSTFFCQHTFQWHFNSQNFPLRILLMAKCQFLTLFWIKLSYIQKLILEHYFPQSITF